MTSARAWTLSMSIVLMMVPVPGLAQTQFDPWEFTIGGRIGAPVGHLQVGESIGGGSTPGTKLSLSDLGVHVSETIEASVAYHFTPDDALRVSALYTFLRGDSTPSQSVVYNGLEFKPGSLHANTDYWRVDLAYERALVRSAADELIGSIGLAYVFFNPTLSNSQQNSRENSEDFYLQELPVPIAGIRWSHALGQSWLLRLGVSGGGLPKVNSLREEGGTVYLQQSHADADVGIAYRWRGGAELEVGYHFTYFFQHETSHEDDNRFELIDNGLRTRFSV